jgi:hypothetical protein
VGRGGFPYFLPSFISCRIDNEQVLFPDDRWSQKLAGELSVEQHSVPRDHDGQHLDPHKKQGIAKDEDGYRDRRLRV